jgi:hypothetical protein
MSTTPQSETAGMGSKKHGENTGGSLGPVQASWKASQSSQSTSVSKSKSAQRAPGPASTPGPEK